MTVEVKYRRDLGAYLLGALEPAEEASFAEHLRRCGRCHAELLDLGGVVADLAVLARDDDISRRMDVTSRRMDVTAPGTAADAASGATPGAAPKTAPRPGGAAGDRALLPRRRLFAVAAAAAGLASAGGAALVVSRSGAEPTPPAAAVTAPAGPAAPGSHGPAPPPGGRVVEGRNAKAAVTGRAELAPAAWGTDIQFTVAGMQRAARPGLRCALVAVSTTGETDTAGSWAVPAHSQTPAGERFDASTAIPLSRLSKLLVVTADGLVLLSIAV
jgi:hypothetical protein